MGARNRGGSGDRLTTRHPIGAQGADPKALPPSGQSPGAQEADQRLARFKAERYSSSVTASPRLLSSPAVRASQIARWVIRVSPAEPWKCPECGAWINPSVAEHRCSAPSIVPATSTEVPANAIVMTPTRWEWMMATGADSTGRPLVVPIGEAFNAFGQYNGLQNGPIVAGTVAGLPVYVDGNIPSDLGTETNQDEIFVLHRQSHWLMEGPSWSALYRRPSGISSRSCSRSTATWRSSGIAMPTRPPSSAELAWYSRPAGNQP